MSAWVKVSSWYEQDEQIFLPPQKQVCSKFVHYCPHFLQRRPQRAAQSWPREWVELEIRRQKIGRHDSTGFKEPLWGMSLSLYRRTQPRISSSLHTSDPSHSHVRFEVSRVHLLISTCAHVMPRKVRFDSALFFFFCLCLRTYVSWFLRIQASPLLGSRFPAKPSGLDCIFGRSLMFVFASRSWLAFKWFTLAFFLS